MEQSKIKIGKRIVAVVMLLVMLFGNLSSVFAAEGNDSWVGQQYPSYFFTEESNQRIGICLRKVRGGDGNEKVVFCAEHGKDFFSGVQYDGYYYTPTSNIAKRICKIAYFGWYSKYGNYVYDDSIIDDSNYEIRKDAAFTQQYIWNTMNGNDVNFLDGNVQAEFNAFKADIDNKINSIEQKPSFNYGEVTLDKATSINVNDDNGVLSSYKSVDSVVDGLRIIHNEGENFLTLEATNECNSEYVSLTEDIAKSIGLIKAGTENYDTTIYIDLSDEVQDQVYAMNYEFEETLALNIKVNQFGKLEIEKKNLKGELLNGATFKIKNDDGFEQDVLAENGKVTLEHLRPGTYHIQELKVDCQHFFVQFL